MALRGPGSRRTASELPLAHRAVAVPPVLRFAPVARAGRRRSPRPPPTASTMTSAPARRPRRARPWAGLSNPALPPASTLFSTPASTRPSRRPGRGLGGFGPALPVRVQHEHRLADLDLVARLDLHVAHGALDAGRHLDRRLVRLEFEDRLIARNRVADVHHHAGDIATHHVLAKFRNLELCHFDSGRMSRTSATEALRHEVSPVPSRMTSVSSCLRGR